MEGLMQYLGTGETMEPISNILTVRQLATYLNMASVTIYRLAARGELPGTKVGGQWRFHKQAIDEWLSRKPDRKRIKILVVDDDVQVGELFREALPAAQFLVHLAASGREAVAALATETYQVAFIDLLLPEQSSCASKDGRRQVKVAFVDKWTHERAGRKEFGDSVVHLARSPAKGRDGS